MPYGWHAPPAVATLGAMVATGERSDFGSLPRPVVDKHSVGEPVDSCAHEGGDTPVLMGSRPAMDRLQHDR